MPKKNKLIEFTNRCRMTAIYSTLISLSTQRKKRGEEAVWLKEYQIVENPQIWRKI